MADADQPLREWQQHALDEYFHRDASDFLAVVTPGGGKTYWSLMVAANLPQAERVVVVCPTVHLKAQWARDAIRFGLKLSSLHDIQSNDIITTYQQVAQNVELFADLVTDPPCQRRKLLGQD
jgi:superfamily II DNA or RNA helicase